MNTKKGSHFIWLPLEKTDKERGVGAESSMCSYASFSCMAVK